MPILLFIFVLPLSAQASIRLDLSDSFRSLRSSLSYHDSVWVHLRSHFSLPDYHQDPRVQKQIAWLLHDKVRFEKMLADAAPYLYYVTHEVSKRDMPTEIALLPMIESSYDPFAYSHAGAAGLWQLMPGTATGFGLKHGWWYDGRRDVYESTQVALDYLSYLYKFFDGSWEHALAAYDSGEGTVQKAVLRNQEVGKSTDIWDLKLPRETRLYIPRLFAIVTIIKNPQRYNVTLPDIADRPVFSRIDLDFQVNFADVAAVTNLQLAQIYELNPGYNRWATDPDGPFSIVLPIEKIELFQKNLSSVPKRHHAVLKKYHVKSGDTLSVIARRFNTTVALLKTANKLRSSRIRIGKTLVLPDNVLDGSIDRSRSVVTPKIAKLGPRKIVHVVKPHESISQIARRYHVRIAQLQFWNQLDYRNRINPGMKLTIWRRKKHMRGRARFQYQVKKGDSLSLIAHKYRVTIAALRRWNPSIRGNIIIPGHTLRIYRS